MVSNPDDLLGRYVEAGCELVIVHAETCTHLHKTLAQIRALGARSGVALNPSTGIEAVRHVVDLMDLLLVMTVNPGFGGQAYIATMEPKIAEARALIDRSGFDIELEVDGGIAPSTIAGAAGTGADVLVAGSALFRDSEGLEHAVSDLRARAIARYQAREADLPEPPAQLGHLGRSWAHSHPGGEEQGHAPSKGPPMIHWRASPCRVRRLPAPGSRCLRRASGAPGGPCQRPRCHGGLLTLAIATVLTANAVILAEQASGRDLITLSRDGSTTPARPSPGSSTTAPTRRSPARSRRRRRPPPGSPPRRRRPRPALLRPWPLPRSTPRPARRPPLRPPRRRRRPEGFQGRHGLGPRGRHGPALHREGDQPPVQGGRPGRRA